MEGILLHYYYPRQRRGRTRVIIHENSALCQTTPKGEKRNRIIKSIQQRPMIAGIGIDILSLTRFRTLLLKRDPIKLAKRICTPVEYDLFQKLNNVSLEDNFKKSEGNKEGNEVIDKQLKFLSCRWALKEASYKSLSNHLNPISWKDLQITHLKNGSLDLYITNPEYREKFSLMGSLSHDGGMVVGVVIAQFNSK